MRSDIKLAGRFDRVMAQAMDAVVAFIPLVMAMLFLTRMDSASGILILLVSLPWLLFHTLLADGLGDEVAETVSIMLS